MHDSKDPQGVFREPSGGMVMLSQIAIASLNRGGSALIFGAHPLAPLHPALEVSIAELEGEGSGYQLVKGVTSGLSIACFQRRPAGFLRLLRPVKPGQQGHQHPVLLLSIVGLLGELMGHPMPPGANPLANREKLLLKGGDGPLSGLAAIGGCQGGEGVQGSLYLSGHRLRELPLGMLQCERMQRQTDLLQSVMIRLLVGVQTLLLSLQVLLAPSLTAP